jgi:hypothetical protein
MRPERPANAVSQQAVAKVGHLRPSEPTTAKTPRAISSDIARTTSSHPRGHLCRVIRVHPDWLNGADSPTLGTQMGVAVEDPAGRP